MHAQFKQAFNMIEPIPDKEGFAGMYAGVSKGKVFCMGGANFPEKRPWEGGAKVWYDDIYMMNENHDWVKTAQHMPIKLAYGVSISYKNQLLLIGGYNESGYQKTFYSCIWNGTSCQFTELKSLPIPLANMAGSLVGDLIIVAGGTSSSTGEPLSVVFGFDLKHPQNGWFNLPAWPGPSRTQPVSASTNNHFYLFSGETVGVDSAGNKYRNILKDAYEFSPAFMDGKWIGNWKKRTDLPHGVSASANPAPMFNNQYVLFWGGLDSATARIKDPVTHPGFPKTLLIFDIKNNTSKDIGFTEEVSPVTLPSVKWNNKWLFISGEKKPGVRTNQVIQLSIQQP